jgi:hypothetical protein
MEVLGIGNSEEAAWQNAAESLPAQPERECIHESRWINAGPLSDDIAYLECKKCGILLERPIPKPAERAKQTYQGRAGYEYSQRGGQYAIYCAGHCIAECEDAEVAEWICENWNKPQPDSSSIPDPLRATERLIERYQEALDNPNTSEIESKALRVNMRTLQNTAKRLRDSSSISTEQTFEEWFDIWESETSGFTVDELVLCRNSAESAWNAAKGLK